WCTSCSAPAAATAWPPCASAAARASPRCSSGPDRADAVRGGRPAAMLGRDPNRRWSMRPVPCLLSLLLAALPALPASAEVARAQRPEVAEAAQRLRDQVVAWRRDFHRHPELSNREERTARVVAEELRRMGLEPRTGIAGHGVVAVVRGGRPGPRIALRADMDALPVAERTGLPFASTATAEYRGQTVGVMHACGHDAHTGILLGVARALVDMRERLP